MPSATSFFSPTLYRKNLVRFCPLWILYGLIWLYDLPLSLLKLFLDHVQADDITLFVQKIPNSLSLLGTGTAALFGLFAAMAVFSYLYSSRSACGIHALPLRREALFLTSWLSGLTFLLLPNGIIVLLTLLVGLMGAPMGALLSMLGLWFLVQSGLCLFFYSFACFCAMFTGHILALPAFYGILNFLAAGLVTLVEELCTQFFYGFRSLPPRVHSLVEILTPVIRLSRDCQWFTSKDPPQLRNPSQIVWYVLAALVMTLVALALYRRRQLESAGDVVSVRLARPLFRYGLAFCVGISVGTLTASFMGSLDNHITLMVLIVAWTAVGCFLGEMLLRRSFRVLKAWKGTAVMSTIMAVLCMACIFDWFGYSTRVPELDQVASLRVKFPYSAPYDTASGRPALTFTDPEQIEPFLQLHQIVAQQGDSPQYRLNPYDQEYYSVELSYTLKSGSSLEREFYFNCFESDLDRSGTTAWAMQQVLNRRDLVEQAYQFDRFEQSQGRMVGAHLENLWNPAEGSVGKGLLDYFYLDSASPDQLKELWEAVRADFDQGTIGVRYLFDNDPRRMTETCATVLRFDFSVDSAEMGFPSDLPLTEMDQELEVTSSLRITLTPNASRTIGWLEDHGVLTPERALLPWEDYVSAVG